MSLGCHGMPWFEWSVLAAKPCFLFQNRHFASRWVACVPLHLSTAFSSRARVEGWTGLGIRDMVPKVTRAGEIGQATPQKLLISEPHTG